MSSAVAPLLYFYTPWKREKTKVFLIFSKGIEMKLWAKIGYCAYNYRIARNCLKLNDKHSLILSKITYTTNISIQIRLNFSFFSITNPSTANSFRTSPVCLQRISERPSQSRSGNSILFSSGYRPLVDAKL